MDRMPTRLLLVTMLVVAALVSGAAAGEPAIPVGPPLAILPGIDGHDLDGVAAADGTFTVFQSGHGALTGMGRITCISRLTGERTGRQTGSILPQGRQGKVQAFGPVAIQSATVNK